MRQPSRDALRRRRFKVEGVARIPRAHAQDGTAQPHIDVAMLVYRQDVVTHLAAV